MSCGLRREIENMLLLVPGRWRLKLTKRKYTLSLNTKYEILQLDDQSHPVVVVGYGDSKAAALENLLYNWRHGSSGFGSVRVKCPASSKEELELKLALLDADCRKPKR